MESIPPGWETISGLCFPTVFYEPADSKTTRPNRTQTLKIGIADKGTKMFCQWRTPLGRPNKI
jgi:hypothetical protein